MISQAIDTHDIDEGLDRKQLTQIKQRFLSLNQQRLERARLSLSERQQQFLQLLPLLFHVNHPQLPGYHSGATPAGLVAFEPDKELLRLAKVLARSYQYKRDLNEKSLAIDALFIMGSVGSIGYSEASDLDIWVCHDPLLDSQQQLDLEQKCLLISNWAQQHINLEVHFFLMTGERFRAGHVASLSSEASGSAQHFLLLDEFYRTALWLGGKVPLWWFVPASQEDNYADYSEQLLSKRFIKTRDVIDFGGVPLIPTNEFIGAGSWQLYKAIESPHKSVLKLLLLEVYAQGLQVSNGSQLPLALDFKMQVYASRPDVDLLDPYVMAYRRVEAYLQQLGQPPRLELARRCFYFKANRHLSKKTAQEKKSWQRLLLEKLVGDWNWSSHLLHMLDNRSYWKAPHVIAERALLANELNHSYRLLLELNKHLEQQAAISTDELMILGRKLHAAFERKAGKIEWINPGISRDLSEPALCLEQMASEGEENWQLLRGSERDLSLRSVAVEPIKRARSLLELLLWSQANGLLVQGTKVDIISKQFALTQVQKQQLLQRLGQWLPKTNEGEHHQVFTRATFVEQILWVVNLGVEPQSGLIKKGMQKLSSQRDALGFSGLKENLVLSVDLVVRNSWGETTVRRFARDALVNALLYCLRLLSAGGVQLLPQFTVDCFSLGQGTAIAQRLSELWREIVSGYFGHGCAPNARYIFEAGDEYLLLQFLHRQPQITRFKSYDRLLDKLAQAQAEYSPLICDSYALRDKPLGAICQQVKRGGIYVFFRVKGNLAELSLVDNKGSLFYTHCAFFNQQTFLRPLLGFIHSTMQRLHWDGDLSHSQGNDQVKIFELELQAGSALAGQHKCQFLARATNVQLSSDAGQILQVKVIAEPTPSDTIGYSIMCNEREFSSLAFGDEIYSQVAEYIIQHRQGGERYPCYITDLDLSLCRDIIAQQTGLQLSHYLQIKVDLEQRLNAELLKL